MLQMFAIIDDTSVMNFRKILQHNFPKMRGQRPFGTFPKIHPFWNGYVSLTKSYFFRFSVFVVSAVVRVATVSTVFISLTNLNSFNSLNPSISSLKCQSFCFQALSLNIYKISHRIKVWDISQSFNCRHFYKLTERIWVNFRAFF